MKWHCIETDTKLPPGRYLVADIAIRWWGLGDYTYGKWFDAGTSHRIDPTHYAEVELPQDLSVKWPRDWGKVVMARSGESCPWRGPVHLCGRTRELWWDGAGNDYLYVRLATPEEAGDMQPLTVPEEVNHG